MSRRSLRTWSFSIILGLTIVLPPASANAGAFVADFTDPAWTVNDNTTVTLTPTTATIAENPASLFFSVDLSQSFTIPAGATTLTFSILSLTTDPTQNDAIPPFFSANLRDHASGVSLVPEIAPDAGYYARDLTDPTFSEGIALGVTVNPSGSSMTPITVSLDISAVPASTVADLVFSVDPILSLNNDPVVSTPAAIEISDVSINGGTVVVPTIPEPAGIVLFGLGIAAIAGHVWRKRAALA